MQIPKSASLDPSVQDHLLLKNFTGKFDVTDFVGSISEKLITQSQTDNGPFDPKPFIQTFEAAVDKLIAVRKDVQAKTEQMEKSVRVSEREYSKKMADLNRGFEAVGGSFAGMEARMNTVSSTAVRIGEQLETVHLERQRAQAAYDIIDFYNQLSKGDTARLDTMRKEGRAGRRQVAVILRRLNTVAKEVDLPNADKTRENIEKYCEKFEKEMLNLFDRCYRKGDPKMMHVGRFTSHLVQLTHFPHQHCAQTLLEFNGGASCVQVYVNQHDFFINNVRNNKPVDDHVLWDLLPDPDASPPKSEQGLTELFVEIRSTVETEAQIVKAVFPNPSVVMQVFLQRVFAQSIQQHMEQLLHRGTSVSDLAYLRVLQLVHIQASTLVDDLKTYELPHVSPRTPYEATEFRKSLAGSTTIAPGTSAAVSTMLESAMEELFVPYIEGQRYLERESRSLGTLYSSLLSQFTRYHEKTQKGKSSMFDRMVNQLSAAAATTSTSGGSTTSAQAAAALMRFGGINAPNQDGEEPVREEDGLLSVDIAEKMLKWHAEAIGRCVELSPANDNAKNTFALLRVLAEAIGNAYIGAAIETAQVRVEAADPKVEPSLQPLYIIRSVDLICHLWQQYINTALLPLASSSVTTRREMVVFNNQSVSRLEGGANHLLQRVTDSVVAWLSTQLTKQKRNDFNPRDDDLSFARVNTDPCLACCEVLEKVRDSASQNLSGKNLEVFLTEIGIAFHRDIKSYQDTIGTFGIPALHERFEFIRQLGNVFLVRPEILKSYITENYLGRIDATLLKPYLMLRSDWGQFGKLLNDTQGLPDEGTEGRGLKDRFGRLSVMMKDLEGLKLSDGIPRVPAGFAGGFSMPSRPFSN
ncbi:hypothetical protein DXG01_005662 [Tephrocybe rancida]|nr:hypothetical protein DXG01_005662 [Tephrocybe rancida]